MRTWSELQLAIFEWFARGLGHLIVRARAGCAKTTSIIEGINRAPEEKILLCAFNKKIAEELSLRITNPHAQAKTLHAIGFAAVRRFWPDIQVNDPKKHGTTRKEALTEKACGQRVPDAIKKLVTKLHTLGREIVPHAETGEQLLDLAYAFECEPDEEWLAAGWTIEQVCSFAASAMFHAAEEKPRATGIDFADMIFLPVRNGWLTKTYDLVVVDEAQDMTVAQLEIARGVCKGRICVVGDDRQAIYGFRGADAASLDRLKAELGAAELGLNTTYRCGQAIVEMAARLVPDFQAGPSNPEGEISSLPEEKLIDVAQLGDFVLSRTNAPLVATAMKLLRSGKRTRIAGRDIGAGLKTLVKKLSKSARSVPEFLDRLKGWEEREIRRVARAIKNAEAAEKQVEAIQDKAEMLRDLADDARNLEEIQERIEALFTDDGLGQAGMITCSSVHRAKGLEAERVFLLADTFRDKGIEEQNICYVAITRAKTSLVIVGTPACAAICAPFKKEAPGCGTSYELNFRMTNPAVTV